MWPGEQRETGRSAAANKAEIKPLSATTKPSCCIRFSHEACLTNSVLSLSAEGGAGWGGAFPQGANCTNHRCPRSSWWDAGVTNITPRLRTSPVRELQMLEYFYMKKTWLWENFHKYSDENKMLKISCTAVFTLDFYENNGGAILVRFKWNFGVTTDPLRQIRSTAITYVQ